MTDTADADRLAAIRREIPWAPSAPHYLPNLFAYRVRDIRGRERTLVPQTTSCEIVGEWRHLLNTRGGWLPRHGTRMQIITSDGVKMRVRVCDIEEGIWHDGSKRLTWLVQM